MAELIGAEVSRARGRRQENLDPLRAVAALAIVFGHSYQLGGHQLPFVTDRISDLVLRQTATGVWLFFVLSGYLIARPFIWSLIDGTPLPENVPYSVRRAFRIFPAYWIALTAVIVLAGAGTATRSWHYPVHYLLLQNLVPGRQAAIFPVAWTLTLELLFYISVPVLATAIRRIAGPRPISPSGLATGVAVTWAISYGASIVAAVLPPSTKGQWLRASFPMMWSFFCPGILLAIGPRTARNSRWHRVLVDISSSNAGTGVAFALMVMATFVHSTLSVSSSNFRSTVTFNVVQQLFVLAYALIVGRAIAAAPWSKTIGRWVNELGLISYGIYLYHAVFVVTLMSPGNQRFIPLHHGGVAAYLVHVTFVLLFTLPVAMLSWRYVERPLNDLARRMVGSSFATRRNRPTSAAPT
jgi:peptidoglycan/LPS O-acetylase OafA/YrhL